jgi:hypothetical protein
MNLFTKSNIGLKQLGFLGGVFAVIILVDSCIHEPFIDPFALNGGQPSTPGCVSNGQVCFESSVLPIFLSSCAKSGCHDASTREEGFVLDNYSNIVKKGITPGKANESKLYEVLFKTGDDQMPPDAPLSKAQKDSIADWINQGAKNTVDCNCACEDTQFTYAITIQPLINSNCVGCHKPSSLGGGIDLTSYTLVKAQADNGKLLGSVTHAVGYSPMPQGSKLSDCQINQIKNWINAGTLNN